MVQNKYNQTNQTGAYRASVLPILGIMSIVMGLVANVPFYIASGVGINTIFVFSIIYGLGLSWQKAMGTVFIQ